MSRTMISSLATQIVANNNAGAYQFTPAPTGIFEILNGSNSNVLTVLNSGNVGIGTTNPLAPLSVVPASGKMFTMTSDQYGNPTWFSGDTNSDQTTGMNFQVGRLGSLAYDKGASLNLYGNKQDAPTGAGLAGGIVFSTAQDASISSSNGMAMLFRTGVGRANNNESMRIDRGGNVGIGTTNPSVPLEILGTSGIKLNRNSYSSAAFNLTNVGGSGDQGLIFDANAFEFRINASTGKFAILNNGNVGICTTSPNMGKLVVQGSTGTGSANFVAHTLGVAQGEVASFSLYSTFTGTARSGSFCWRQKN